MLTLIAEAGLTETVAAAVVGPRDALGLEKRHNPAIAELVCIARLQALREAETAVRAKRIGAVTGKRP